MDKVHKQRIIILILLILVIAIIFLYRLINLTIFNRNFLQNQGNARSIRIINIPAYRGIIADRYGVPLAISTPVESLWINPKIFNPTSEQINKLSQLLGLPSRELVKKINKKREFIYIKRQIPPALIKKINSLQIPGLNIQQEFKRYYPQAETVAQLIGFTNIDDKGLEGLELVYESWLGGIIGKKQILKDRSGQIVAEIKTIQPSRAGNNLILSIDHRLQYLAYQELQNTVNKFHAKSASAIILNTNTGEILASANFPSFNPNIRRYFDYDSYRNKALTDSFEPGSVIKPFSIASALESGKLHYDTLIDTSPNVLVIQKNIVKDEHNYGLLNITQILQHSSNIGISKIVLLNSANHLINFFTNCGFGSKTESSYPGESDGSITKIQDTDSFMLATMGFGYGLTVTLLQLAKAYLIFANDGQILPISFLPNETKPVSKQIISKKTANKVLTMLEAVLENEGTGKLARIHGYRIAGKTGTAKIAGKKGYKTGHYIASFIGIAPVTSPQLIVAVMVREPTLHSYYSSKVAAPLFAKIMEGALRILEIPPDKPLKMSINQN